MFDLLNDDLASAASRILPFLFSSEERLHPAAFRAPVSKRVAALAALSVVRRLLEQLRMVRSLISSTMAPFSAIFRGFHLVFLLLVPQQLEPWEFQLSVELVGQAGAFLQELVVVAAVEQFAEELVKLEEHLAELEFLERPSLISATTVFLKL